MRCGSYARHGWKRHDWKRHDRRHHGWGHHRRGYFGLDVEEMNPRTRVVVALAVLAPVALSGAILAFTPVWWIFTTYFWVAFPAFGLLLRGVAGLGEARPARFIAQDGERELLSALQTHGELTPAGVAAETSLSVSEADRRLKELADGGHLDVRVRGGGIFYALWESGEGESRKLERAT